MGVLAGSRNTPEVPDFLNECIRSLKGSSDGKHEKFAGDELNLKVPVRVLLLQ